MNKTTASRIHLVLARGASTGAGSWGKISLLSSTKVLGIAGLGNTSETRIGPDGTERN